MEIPQTLALVNLQVRGEEVQSYLPRVLALLNPRTDERLFGRDALRLVFTELASDNDYDRRPPRRSAAARSASCGWDLNSSS